MGIKQISHMLQKIPYGKFNSILHRSRIFSVYDDNKRILPTSTISIHLNALWLRTTESKVAKKSKGKKELNKKTENRWKTNNNRSSNLRAIYESMAHIGYNIVRQWLSSFCYFRPVQLSLFIQLCLIAN